MDLNSTIDIVIKDLNEAREIIDDLKKYPGVPELQVELAKSKCKSAAEVIALFKNLQPKINSPVQEKPPVKEEKIQEKLPEKPDKVIVVTEKEVKEVAMTVISEAPPMAKEEPVQTIKKPAESAIIADRFSNRPESFNEKLGNLKHEDDVLEILKTKPLSSLDEAIGINDKFLFIREIFDGNSQSYNQAIQKLESVGSLSDAMAVIMSYTGENTGNEAVKQLLDLIKRKFLAHE
jgi:copper chaperone CopZ